jgi:plastocyanin
MRVSIVLGIRMREPLGTSRFQASSRITRLEEAFRMTTETIRPPETDNHGHAPDGNGAEPQNARAWHEWLAVGVGVAGLLSIAAIIVSLVALSSKNPTTGPRTVTIQTAAPAATPAVAPLAVHMTLKSDTEHGKKGPDGQWHDAILGGNLNVKAGQTVTVTIASYDDSPHSYTAPDLGLNVRISGGSATTPTVTKFTFKAPAKAGTYQWFCAFPCDPWAMAHDGYMRGHVTVTA